MEFIVQSQMCDLCHRREAKDFWRAVVQIRQKVSECSAVSYSFILKIKCIHQSYCKVVIMLESLFKFDFTFCALK